jgi:hypothetical protein
MDNPVMVNNAQFLDVLKNGTLWAWGANINWEVGDGTRQPRLTPVKIMSDVIRISSMGLQHFMALKEDGTLWTWGVNNKGQLGDGTTQVRSKPVKIMSNVINFNNGINFSFAIKKDNTLWAWGCNNCGQLGTGDKKDRLKPVKILDLDSFISKGNYTKPNRYIDGYMNDWGTSKPVISDATDDSVDNSTELKKIYAYSDKKFLYLALSFSGSLSQATFYLDHNGDKKYDYQIIYDSQNKETYIIKKGRKGNETYRINNVNDILELRIPLSAIGKPGKFYLYCELLDSSNQFIADKTEEWSFVDLK